jgi:hypothetical protein
MTCVRTLLLVLLVAIVPFSAYAQSADSDILLTSGGVLYTIESEFGEKLGINVPSSKVLSLHIQTAEKTESVLVPASLTGGMHTNPALAYDNESGSLFVFWQKTPFPQLTSDLLFASYQNGHWSDATLVNKAGFEIRRNLRLATTRYYLEREADGSATRKSGLIVHMVWWAETGYGETAGYAMLRLENGLVGSIQTADLVDLLGANREPSRIDPVPVEFNREIFRHPSLAGTSTHDAVEITFADWDTNRFQNVTIRPITDEGVLDPPIGVWGGSFGPPRSFYRSVETTSRVTVLPSGDRGKILFHFRNGNAVEYLMVDTKTSTWTDVRTVALNEKVSEEMATEALRRLAASE